jgi:hypothetical protein
VKTLPCSAIVRDLMQQIVSSGGNTLAWFPLKDALEECGRADVWRILHNQCPECGGRLRRVKIKQNLSRMANNERDWYCVECREVDVDHCDGPKEWHDTFLYRALRELGLRKV